MLGLDGCSAVGSAVGLVGETATGVADTEGSIVAGVSPIPVAGSRGLAGTVVDWIPTDDWVRAALGV
jgi:hypothetical protein